MAGQLAAYNSSGQFRKPVTNIVRGLQGQQGGNSFSYLRPRQPSSINLSAPPSSGVKSAVVKTMVKGGKAVVGATKSAANHVWANKYGYAAGLGGAVAAYTSSLPSEPKKRPREQEMEGQPSLKKQIGSGVESMIKSVGGWINGTIKKIPDPIKFIIGAVATSGIEFGIGAIATAITGSVAAVIGSTVAAPLVVGALGIGAAALAGYGVYKFLNGELFPQHEETQAPEEVDKEKYQSNPDLVKASLEAIQEPLIPSNTAPVVEGGRSFSSYKRVENAPKPTG